MALPFSTIIRIAVAAAMLSAAAPVLAQTPGTDSGAAPAITLSPEQKQTIYQSVSATQKNHAAPTGFRVAVGGQMPDLVEFNPVPQTLVTLIPTLKELQVALVEKQVVLVDPKSKLVVAVFAHGE